MMQTSSPHVPTVVLRELQDSTTRLKRSLKHPSGGGMVVLADHSVKQVLRVLEATLYDLKHNSRLFYRAFNIREARRIIALVRQAQQEPRVKRKKKR